MPVDVKESNQPVSSPERSPGIQREVRIDIKPRGDLAAGVIEVVVTRDQHESGSSFVLTTPRELAVRRKVG